MIYDEKSSLLLCTGLGLEKISKLSGRDGNAVERELRKFGKKYLDRYRIFCEYKKLVETGRLKEPIIPIIAAMPCVGKTTMAREIATAFGIGNVVGGDAFRSALRDFFSKEKTPEFFTSVYDAWKFFGEKNNENIIKGFEAQAQIINRAIERMVADRGIRDGESIVFEYLHFLPSQYDKEILGHPSVIPVVLRLNADKIYKERIGMRDRRTHLKGDSSRLLSALDAYKIMQDFQCKDAKKYGIPVVSTDNWEKAVDEVLSIISARIGKLITMKEVKESSKIVKLRKERNL
ncbi:MAG: hypothetical protein HY515_03400 [Candidatus Aenigmarchaeota archaeon]|nr:hypothetical protein [Candidatus Aenigmarchaeota archaeon]